METHKSLTNRDKSEFVPLTARQKDLVVYTIYEQTIFWLSPVVLFIFFYYFYKACNPANWYSASAKKKSDDFWREREIENERDCFKAY